MPIGERDYGDDTGKDMDGTGSHADTWVGRSFDSVKDSGYR